MANAAGGVETLGPAAAPSWFAAALRCRAAARRPSAPFQTTGLAASGGRGRRRLGHVAGRAQRRRRRLDRGRRRMPWCDGWRPRPGFSRGPQSSPRTRRGRESASTARKQAATAPPSSAPFWNRRSRRRTTHISWSARFFRSAASRSKCARSDVELGLARGELVLELPDRFPVRLDLLAQRRGLIAGLRDVGLELGDVLALRLDALLELRGGGAQVARAPRPRRPTADEALPVRCSRPDWPATVAASSSARPPAASRSARSSARDVSFSESAWSFSVSRLSFAASAASSLADPLAQGRKFGVIGIQPRHFRARARQFGGGLSQVGRDLVALAASRRGLLPERLDVRMRRRRRRLGALRMPARSAR